MNDKLKSQLLAIKETLNNLDLNQSYDIKQQEALLAQIETWLEHVVARPNE